MGGITVDKTQLFLYPPGFFISLGFKEVEKEMFPEKIWADCLKCAKFNCCDEKAVLFQADDV